MYAHCVTCCQRVATKDVEALEAWADAHERLSMNADPDHRHYVKVEGVEYAR